nr:hypothetical protein CFP56_78805 [Quercus suber]
MAPPQPRTAGHAPRGPELHFVHDLGTRYPVASAARICPIMGLVAAFKAAAAAEEAVRKLTRSAYEPFFIICASSRTQKYAQGKPSQGFPEAIAMGDAHTTHQRRPVFMRGQQLASVPNPFRIAASGGVVWAVETAVAIRLIDYRHNRGGTCTDTYLPLCVTSVWDGNGNSNTHGITLLTTGLVKQIHAHDALYNLPPVLVVKGNRQNKHTCC